MTSGKRIILAVGAALVVVLVGVAVFQSTRPPADVASRASATPTPQASASPTASSPASASSTPSPLPSGPPADGLEAYALGTLRGEYAFVLNGGASETPGAIAELWAIPLAGGQPKLAARYVNATSPGGQSGVVGDNSLRRQLSPDGRRVILSAVTPRSPSGQRLSLFIVDLESGRKTKLGTDDADNDRRPAWSPDGTRIAYVRLLSSPRAGGGLDDGIWMMNVDGTSVRQVIPSTQGNFTYLYGWTADSRSRGPIPSRKRPSC